MTITRLPRTLRLDPSDTFVFAEAAPPGEWAVTGSFLFLDCDPLSLDAKGRAAFRSGFLGIRSFGFSTLVVVTEASAAEVGEAVSDLADHLRTRLGAPSAEAAREAAAEEVAVAASLCSPPVGTVLALRRVLEDGELREQFRTLNLRQDGTGGGDRLHATARAFAIVESDDDEPGEHVDLLRLGTRGR